MNTQKIRKSFNGFLTKLRKKLTPRVVEALATAGAVVLLAVICGVAISSAGRQNPSDSTAPPVIHNPTGATQNTTAPTEVDLWADAIPAEEFMNTLWNLVWPEHTKTDNPYMKENTAVEAFRASGINRYRFIISHEGYQYKFLLFADTGEIYSVTASALDSETEGYIAEDVAVTRARLNFDCAAHNAQTVLIEADGEVFYRILFTDFSSSPDQVLCEVNARTGVIRDNLQPLSGETAVTLLLDALGRTTPPAHSFTELFTWDEYSYYRIILLDDGMEPLLYYVDAYIGKQCDFSVALDTGANIPDGTLTEDMLIQIALDQLGYTEEMIMQTALELIGCAREDVEDLYISWDTSSGESAVCSVHIGQEYFHYEVFVNTSDPDNWEYTENILDYKYRGAPNDISVFRFDGEQPFYGLDIDISALEVGYLYRYDEVTGKIKLLTGPVCDWLGYGIGYEATEDHIYYSPADEPSKIYRMNYDGQDNTLICDMGSGVINMVAYSGINPQGKIYILLDHNRVVLYDITDGTTETVMEQYYIGNFYRDTETDPDDPTRWIELIFWHGFLCKEDMDARPHEEFEYSYVYNTETGENTIDTSL